MSTPVIVCCRNPECGESFVFLRGAITACSHCGCEHESHRDRVVVSSGFTEFKVDFEIEAEDLFEGLQNSAHMKRRGYKILYSGDLLSQGCGVYKLCLKQDEELLYLHLRFNFGKIGCIYLMTLGDEKIILSDLEAALKEVR